MQKETIIVSTPLPTTPNAQVSTKQARKRSFDETALDSMTRSMGKCNLAQKGEVSYNLQISRIFGEEPDTKKCKRLIAEDLLSAMFSEDDDLFGSKDSLDSMGSEASFLSSALRIESTIDTDYYLHDLQGRESERLFQ